MSEPILQDSLLNLALVALLRSDEQAIEAALEEEDDTQSRIEAACDWFVFNESSSDVDPVEFLESGYRLGVLAGTRQCGLVKVWAGNGEDPEVGDVVYYFVRPIEWVRAFFTNGAREVQS